MRLASAVIPFLLALPSLSAPAIEESCLKVYYLCLDTVRGLSQEQFHAAPFSISKECTLAATCFPSSPDELLKAINDVVFPGSNNPPKSASSPRLTQGLYNTLAPPGQTANQQSYIDAYYSLLATVGGPYPPASQAILYWTKIAQWAGFCSGGKAIPYQNLADWFQYSNTVSVPPGPCGGASSSALSSVMVSSSVAVSSATASRSISTTTASSTVSSEAPTPTTGSPKEAACAKMYLYCIAGAQQVGEGEWHRAPFDVTKGCILAATCYPEGVNAFLAAIQRDAFVGSTQSPPLAQNVERLSQNLFSTLTRPGTTASQQSYIDAFYSALSAVNGPYPVNTVVIGYWEAIAAWTGFCSGTRTIPYQNLADWFQWSSVVDAPRKC